MLLNSPQLQQKAYLSVPGRPFLAQEPIKGVTEWNRTPVPRLLPCILVSLSCCVPACQEGLCVKSAAPNSCSSSLYALRTRSNTCSDISGLPQQQESIHQRLKTPTDARHYAKLSGPHVTSDIANCTAEPFKPLSKIVSMLSD